MAKKKSPKRFTFKSPTKRFSCNLDRSRCTATKASTGTRCTRATVLGLELCWQHLLATKNLRIAPSTHPPVVRAGGGLGLFASRETRPGARYEGTDRRERPILFHPNGRTAPKLIATYDGEKLTDAALDRRYGVHTAPYTLKGRGGASQARNRDAACHRVVAAFSNSGGSKKWTNAVFRGFNLVAVRPIRDGDEILADYGDSYLMNEEGVSHRTTR